MERVGQVGSPGWRGEFRSWRRAALVIAVGFVLGSLLSELIGVALPQGSATREFFLASVSPSVGPLSIDLRVIAFTVGPVAIRANFMSIVGIVGVAWFSKSLL
ncbi:MAG: DUF4321 domain-containing protein [Gemmatimonadetes bacterium]|nr:DUF4321 domain-containing protein [Gemmatimonadota bacterium]